MGKLPPLLALISRFGLTGLVNTGVGFATAAFLDVGLHVQPALANTAGYLVGVPVSFVLNRTFVFKHHESISATMPRYFASVALAFTLNQLVLHLVGAILGPGARQHLAAQLAGMATYTCINLLVCRFWVFPRQAPDHDDTRPKLERVGDDGPTSPREMEMARLAKADELTDLPARGM